MNRFRLIVVRESWMWTALWLGKMHRSRMEYLG